MSELQTLEYIADIHSLELKFLPSSLLLLVIAVMVLDKHRLICLHHHITLVNQLLVVQQFVRVAHAAIVVHDSIVLLIVKDETIVPFALQVVLNLYFAFVFRLILHDCEELLATLTLFAGETGAATEISKTVVAAGF